ncbi:MAG: glycosyltransferase family 2 protein [Prevotella sp.]
MNNIFITSEQYADITTTLIISTYNREDALSACMDSILHQKVMPTEIVIGDDGSRDDTACVIREFAERCPIPVKHVWHEDDGFRLAMMRNKAVAASVGEYIIEADGDLLLHPCFVKDHLMMARRGYYLKGERTNINRKLTERICRSGKSMPINFLTRGIEKKRSNTLRIPLLARFLSTRYRINRQPGLGCNMSFFRDDFININGYDENFRGWGGEDSDFGRRLQQSGIKKLSLKFAGLCFHLWHEYKDMDNLQNNREYATRQKPTRCKNGVDKYIER